MCPRLGGDLALKLFLDAVVSNRGRGIEAVVHVGLGEVGDEAGVDGVGRPHTRVAVGLQLDPDRAALRALAVAARPIQDTGQILDVVAVLVGEDVGLGERPALAPNFVWRSEKKPRSMYTR